jgi:galactan 5-O-arabinofuranosyltransferase
VPLSPSEVSEAPSAAAADQRPRPQPRVGPAVRALRPLLFFAAAGLVALGLFGLAVHTGADPQSPRTRYGLRFATMVVIAGSVLAVWYARRRRHLWDADLLPALFGGLAGLTMMIEMHGTPFAVDGLFGDQSYRTAMITRFADSWGGDYTYKGLPAFYAPGFFWVLGRGAALLSVEPWRMLKLGDIALVLAAPVVSYLAWRLIVPVRIAALISAVPLLLPDLAEPYAWIVRLAIVPWWLAAVHGIRRPGARRPNVLLLGLAGAVLFCVYYYYFLLFILVFGIMVAVQHWRRELRRADILRGLAVLGITALGSAVFWAPLAWNIVTAPKVESLSNRWLTQDSGDLVLPMLEPTVLGALCLIGLVFLLLSFREPVSRALLVVLAALYLWHAIGFLALMVETPLLSFRMKAMVPIVLLSGAALGLVRGAKYLLRLLPAKNLWPLVTAGAALLALVAVNGFVSTEVTNPSIRAANNETLPDGSLPGLHDPTATARQPSAQLLKEAIDERYSGPGHPVVFSDRIDLFAYYPYYGFTQWNVNYSHPTSRFTERIAFIEDVAKSRTAAEFADRTAHNPYDRIDAFVLRVGGGVLVYTFLDDAFPWGVIPRDIHVPINLIQPDQFYITEFGGWLVAVRRP